MSDALAPNARAHAKASIRQHEGCKAVPYQDSLGVWTVGIGHKLSGQPLTQDVINLIYEHDYAKAERDAAMLPAWGILDNVRRTVLVEMVFQLGAHGVLEFQKFLAALVQDDWQTAHDEMLDSKWARQTPERAQSLARIILTGKYQ